MVARGESMYGCYGDSYSYRLWSLANVWNTYQFPPLSGGDDKPAEAPPPVDEEESVAEGGGTAVSGRGRGGRGGRASPPMPLGPGGPYICAQCGGAYPSKELLEKHEFLHSPNTQSCKICNKSFANVYRLQRHMISHDESALLRKFKCNDCDKAFKFKHHLKEHLRIHSGEKPFECGNCGKKFSHSGSYSSHMTSKKCLVMNLKMGRIRPNNPALNPERSPSRKRSSVALPQMNNNSTPNNNNSFMPILPKYEAAAAFLASITPRDSSFPPSAGALGPAGLHSLYMPPGMPMHPAGAIAPYSLPSSLSHLLEQIATSQYLPRKLESEMPIKDSGSSHSDPEDMIEEVDEDDDKRSSIGDERELVMDIEDDEPVRVKHESPEEERDRPSSIPTPYAGRTSPNYNGNNTGLGGLNMILETVNASVTKHLLQANMHKLSPQPVVSCPRIATPPAPVVKSEPEEILECARCSEKFNHKAELLQHEQVLCGQLFRKHEGLAAQMAETVALNRIESEMHTSANSGLSASEDEDYSKDIDGKLHSENERKVRVRTAISDEQQAKLKEHYARNQRPNREEFKLIAHQLGLDNRVVQVWFQNNRARVRRMNQSLSYSEQPLDLSTKKSSHSTTSSPSVSPSCNASFVHSDFGEEAVNLSQKSSRSPTPYRHPFNTNYQHSNCSSSSLADYRHSPSPCDTLNNGIRRLPHSQYKMLPSPKVGYSATDKLTPYSPDTVNSHSPLSNHHMMADIGRTSCSSPGSERRSWTEESRVSQDINGEENSSKKIRSKKLNHPKEPEGQFVCDQCDKTFVKQSSLARHKYEHSGQRPHQCIQCPRAFKHKHHLTEHKRLHTGEKPFQCCKCLKKFSHSGSFSQHMNHRYSYCKPYRE